GRDRDMVERREQVTRVRDVAAVAEGHALAGAGGDELRHIAVEWLLFGDDFLEQRRLAGIAERAAGTIFALEHGDAVPFRNQRGIGQAGGSGADHGDALALGSAGRTELQLAARSTVDDAAQLRAGARLIGTS